MADTTSKQFLRVIVVGGHTRSIGKTQLVCDVIAAFPEENWVAGKITQYGHGVCPQNGTNCDCAPDEHGYAISWETDSSSGTDSSRFLAAGAKKSFWLRTKQGFLAEGLPLLRTALSYAQNEFSGANQPFTLILESNSVMQFIKPSLYFAVLDSRQQDFKDSARVILDRADAVILRADPDISSDIRPPWVNLPSQLLRDIPSVRQSEGEPLPQPLHVMVRRVLEGPADVLI